MEANAQWSETWFLGVEGYTQSNSCSSNPHLQVTLCVARECMAGLIWPHRSYILKVSVALFLTNHQSTSLSPPTPLSLPLSYTHTHTHTHTHFSYYFLPLKLSAVSFSYHSAIVLLKSISCFSYSTLRIFLWFLSYSISHICPLFYVFTVSPQFSCHYLLPELETASHQHPCHLSPLTQISPPDDCHSKCVSSLLRNFQ